MPFVIGLVVAFVVVRALARLVGWTLGVVVGHPAQAVGPVALFVLS